MAGKLQQFYDKRYEMGYCIYCGEKPYTPKMKTCQTCRTKRAYNKKKRNQIQLEDLLRHQQVLNTTACFKGFEGDY